MTSADSFDHVRWARCPKLRYDLLPPRALEAVVASITFGVEKHDRADGSVAWLGEDRNPELEIAAAMRHIAKYRMGQREDPEQGIHELACAAARLLMALDQDQKCTKIG